MAGFRPCGSGLESARVASGLTLADVADAVLRPPQSVRRWETGATTPPRSVLLALSRMYQVPPTALVD